MVKEKPRKFNDVGKINKGRKKDPLRDMSYHPPEDFVVLDLEALAREVRENNRKPRRARY
jgi:hypothetical protein